MRNRELIEQKQETLAVLEKELGELRRQLEQAELHVNLAASLHNRALGAWKAHSGKLNEIPFDEFEAAAVEESRLKIIKDACHRRYLAECDRRDKVSAQIKQWEQGKASLRAEIQYLKTAPAPGSWEEIYRNFGMR